jgi:malonyl-CoA O-methyltransferase
MADPVGLPTSARPIDRVALQRVRARLRAAPEAPWLHGEVARRMAERLPLIKLQPQRVVDWWAPLGASREVLERACPQAALIDVVETLDAGGGPSARPWWQRLWKRPREVVLEDRLPAADCQLLWSNMGLHLESDVEGLMKRWRQALAVDGFLMFSTLGPGTLDELRALYHVNGWSSPMAPLVDMHDLGDMLVHAGFADPVMDQETLTLTWATADEMLAELRDLGANMDPRRCAGLRTPRWRERLTGELEKRRNPQGRLGMRFEIVYGHAFCPVPRPRVAERTTVSVDDLRTMARSGRKPTPPGH